MQQRRSNTDRSAMTRAALIAAGRALFIEKGFAETGTPELVATAGVTRGALYHHFADKAALFLAVVEAEARAVADEIEAAAPRTLSPRAALTAGGRAFLDAMALPGRTRLLLIEAPAVLDIATLGRIDREHGGRTLAEGLRAAMGNDAYVLTLLPLADLLSAAYDRAALAIADGAARAPYENALEALISGIVGE
ncbi:MAG: TetR/AcrR family transcriptional regulator [Bauldia sp.]